jgi:hypothetical protein
MAIISQNSAKHGFLACQPAISGEINVEFEYDLKKQSQFTEGRNELKAFSNK